MPDLKADERPDSDVLFENCSMAPNVQEALHLCSIDVGIGVSQYNIFRCT